MARVALGWETGKSPAKGRDKNELIWAAVIYRGPGVQKEASLSPFIVGIGYTDSIVSQLNNLRQRCLCIFYYSTPRTYYIIIIISYGVFSFETSIQRLLFISITYCKQYTVEAAYWKHG